MKIVLDIPEKTAYLAMTAVIKDVDKEDVTTGVVRLAELAQAAMVYSIMERRWCTVSWTLKQMRINLQRNCSGSIRC